MGKHTPGPWRVEDRRNAALKNIRIVAGDHKVGEVSDVHQRDYQGSFRGDHEAADALDAVGLANARLIAAAPELLEALKGVVRVADRATNEFDAARTAIAKAVGEEAAKL